VFKVRSHGPYIPGHTHISEEIAVDPRIDEYIPGDTDISCDRSLCDGMKGQKPLHAIGTNSKWWTETKNNLIHNSSNLCQLRTSEQNTSIDSVAKI
jgi:hypothetical protein